MKFTFEDLKNGKVRLEFGNIEQINVIKAHERAIEFAKTMCRECEGEGVITCPACEGSGKKAIKNN